MYGLEQIKAMNMSTAAIAVNLKCYEKFMAYDSVDIVDYDYRNNNCSFYTRITNFENPKLVYGGTVPATWVLERLKGDKLTTINTFMLVAIMRENNSKESAIR